MIRGITPVDTAFELMGLHQAWALTRFFLIESPGGKALFAAGFILSFGAGLTRHSWRPVLTFAGIFFGWWFLFVMPQITLGPVSSVMERNGARELTTVSLLEKNGMDAVIVNPLLDAVDRFLDSTVTGAAAVLDRARGAEGYLVCPFSLANSSLRTAGIVARGLVDPRLKEALSNFYHDHYWLALRRAGGNGLWPGHADILPLYKEEGRRAWEALKENLYNAANAEGDFTVLFDHVQPPPMGKEAVVRAIIDGEMRRDPGRYIHMRYAARHNGLTADAGHKEAFSDIPLAVFDALPFLHGAALYMLLTGFPFFGAAACLVRAPWPGLLFFGLLFSVKAWTLVWACLDAVLCGYFRAVQAWNSAALWEMTGACAWAAGAALFLPAAMTAAAFLIIQPGRRG